MSAVIYIDIALQCRFFYSAWDLLISAETFSTVFSRRHRPIPLVYPGADASHARAQAGGRKRQIRLGVLAASPHARPNRPAASARDEAAASLQNTSPAPIPPKPRTAPRSHARHRGIQRLSRGQSKPSSDLPKSGCVHAKRTLSAGKPLGADAGQTHKPRRPAHTGSRPGGRDPCMRSDVYHRKRDFDLVVRVAWSAASKAG